MDLVTVMQTIVRRWYVVVAVMLATAMAAFLVVTQAESEYEARAVVMLSGLNQAGESQSRAPTDLSVIAELAMGADIESELPYIVEVSGDGTILRVTASAEAPDGLAATVDEVIEVIEDYVAARQSQDGVPQELQVTTEVLATPEARRTIDGVSASYSATGSIHFSAPAQASTGPYPPSAFTLRILQATLESEATISRLWDQGATASYIAGFEFRDAAPIMTLDVLGTEPGQVLHTVESLIALMEEELEQRQIAAGVPQASQTTLEKISVPTFAQLSSSNLLRPLVTVVGLGVIAALALAVFTEGMAQALTRRKQHNQDQPVPASGNEVDISADEPAENSSAADAPEAGPEPSHTGSTELAGLYQERLQASEDRRAQAGRRRRKGGAVRGPEPTRNNSVQDAEDAETRANGRPEPPPAAEAETVEFRLRSHEHWSSQRD